MKMPAQISPWLTDEQLAAWVREAPSQDAYKKRLAIWLTRKGPFHAHRVSDLLQVSKQAVWLWIKQYNQGGPDSLDRKGRGGRRRAYLSLDEERMLVERLQQQVAKGQARKAKELLPEVLAAVGQNVSVAYVYRLMQRHERRRPAPAMRMPHLDGEHPEPAHPGAETQAGAPLEARSGAA
jgi:transposase